MATGSEDRVRLGWRHLAMLSLPMLLVQAIELPWRVYLPAYLTGTLGFPLAAIGTLLFAVRLFDTGFDLFVGWASDRWPTRFGRRKPWMVAGVPMIMLGAVQVFMGRPGLTLPMLVLWALILHIGYTLVVTPHGGWMLEIGRDDRDRLRAIAGKTWFAALAMPLVVLVPSLLERLVAADRALQLRAMGCALLILPPLIIALVARFVPERAEGPGGAQPPALSLPAALRLLARPAPARIALLYALAGLSEATSSGAFIFFAEGTLGLRGWASTLLLGQAGIVIAALPAWTWLGHQIGKSGAMAAALAVQGLAMGAMLLVPAGATGPLLALLALRYACWGADFLFLRAMVADLAGGEIERGYNGSATLYATFNVTLRIALSLGAGLVLWIPARIAAHGGEVSFDQVSRFVFAAPTCLGAAIGILLLIRPADHARRRQPLTLPSPSPLA